MASQGSHKRVVKQSPKAAQRVAEPKPEESLELTELGIDSALGFQSTDMRIHRVQRLQRLAGNQVVARMIAAQSLAGNTAVQRHTIAEAPQLPGPLSDDERDQLSGVPAMQRLTFGGQSAFGKASGQPVLVVQRVADRVKLLQQRIKLGPVTLVPDELPADGAATSQASAKGLGGGQIDWGILGTDYGSTIDAAGVVKAGTNLPKAAVKVPLEIAARDNKLPDKGTIGSLTLWDPKVLQATKDHKKFVADGPYVFANYTAGLNGKFDLTYTPASRTARVTVNVKFASPEAEDQPQAGETPKQVKARLERVAGYKKSFVNRVTSAWSNRYTFKNVREPQSVWGKLNPTHVVVEVKEVAAGEHFTVNFMPRTKGSAAVGGGVANMKAGPAGPVKGHTYLEPRVEFPDTGQNEVNRVKAISPTMDFGAKSSAVAPVYKASLAFLAEYLKRINNPKFTLEVKGRSNPKVESKEWGAKRARAVQSALEADGLTNHSWKNSSEEISGVAGQQADIIPALPGGWQNKQDVTAHEFGHMIGLGDEYPNANAVASKASHHALTSKAFGQKYADQVAKTDAGDRASVMEGGNDVRIQHYVTFWDALVQTTLQKAAVPNPKFDHDDWKFVG